LIGTARILKAGVHYEEVAIGRVVSHADFRHLKIGHELMKAAIEYVETELNTTKIRLSAQSHLLGFYQKHGFESTGKEYLEDGIPHTEMLRQ
jgi:ElaA protein